MIKSLLALIGSRFHETPDGLYHGKSDQQKTQNNISTEQNRINSTSAENISDSQQRVDSTTARSDNERGNIWSGYSNLANNPGAGGAIDQAASDRLLSGNYSGLNTPAGATSPNGSGSGGGGGVPSKLGAPSYIDTYNELSGKTGGFDPTRLDNINNAAGSLYDTSGNYGDVNANIDKLSNAQNNYGATNTSIGGLQNFAATGGLNSDQLSEIQRGSLKNIESTGGYSDEDIANERARSNSGIASTYANLGDTLASQRRTGSNVGPGWSEAGFKLARQGAQAIGTQAQSTEASIHDKVTANKLAAGGKLADLGLGTADLQSKNTLSGYNDAGNLDIAKNTAIQDAWNNAGKLGLGRQAQIDAAKEAAAGIDQQTQSTINQTRLGAAGGLEQDALGRLSIGASSSAMNAALQAENQRFLISEQDQNRNTGLGGMLNTYGTSPSDQQFQQNLLRGYNQDATGANQNMIQNRIGASTIPGIGSTIMSGVNIAGRIAGIGAGAVGGLQGMGQSNPYQFSQPGSPLMGYGMSGLNNPYTTQQQPRVGG